MAVRAAMRLSSARGRGTATTQHYRDARSGRDLLAGFVGSGERRAFGLVLSYALPAGAPDAGRRRLAACAAVVLGDGAPVGLRLNWAAVDGAEPRGELLDRAIAGLAPLR